jgi:DinB superfamily
VAQLFGFIEKGGFSRLAIKTRHLDRRRRFCRRSGETPRISSLFLLVLFRLSFRSEAEESAVVLLLPLPLLLSPNLQACINGGMTSPTKFNQTEAIALLTRTPGTLDALLRGLPSVWAHSNEGKDTWSAFDVVGHLVAGERADWMPRLRIILESGETRPFDPFDRFAQSRESQGKSLEQLLDEFARLRNESLTALKALDLPTQDLARRGRHPTLGTVTLSQLLATWAVHDLTHLHQISRVMAYQYRDAVGPWSVYLGVLQCTGHSAP